jgi:hypothetical protein
MTTLYSGVTSSLFVGHDLLDIDNMPDQQSDQHWQHQQQVYYDQIPLLTGQWNLPTTQAPNVQQQHQSEMFGMGTVNRNVFPSATPSYVSYANARNTSNNLLSPGVGYAPDINWPSDMDIGTPSTFNSPNDSSLPVEIRGSRPPSTPIHPPQAHGSSQVSQLTPTTSLVHPWVRAQRRLQSKARASTKLHRRKLPLATTAKKTSSQRTP